MSLSTEVDFSIFDVEPFSCVGILQPQDKYISTIGGMGNHKEAEDARKFLGPDAQNTQPEKPNLIVESCMNWMLVHTRGVIQEDGAFRLTHLRNALMRVAH